MPKNKTPEIVSRIETITPDEAGQLLGRNTHNRHLRPSLVGRFAAALRKGEWEMNGESIKFDWNGVLIDGQHRLAAVVEANTPMRTIVVHNLPPMAQETVDTGARRSPADIFALRGYERATTLAGAARYLAIMEQGLIKRTGGGQGGSSSSKEKGEVVAEISPQELFAIVGRYPVLPDSIKLTDAVERYTGASHSQMAALHAWFSRLNREAADAFFGALGSGLGLTEGSPIYALRRWLEGQHIKRSGSAHRPRLNRVIVHGVTVKAWNAYRRGEQIKRMHFHPNDDLPVAI